MGLFVALLLFSCQTRGNDSESKAISAANQAKIVGYFEKSCSTCHPTWYRDPAQNSAVTWALLVADSRRIARVTSRPGQGTQMPPALPQSSPARLTDAEIATINLAMTEIAATQRPGGTFENAGLSTLVGLLVLPPGFQIDIYASVKGARSMAQAPNGTVFIGTGGFSNVDREGRVSAIRDVNGDGKIDPGTEQWVIARNLDNPNGVAFLNGDLYVAERFKISRYPDILNHLSSPPAPITITQDFPPGREHSWKYIAAGPDGNLYVAIGSACNICDTEEGATAGKSGRIFRLKLNTARTGVQAREVVAKGVRNSVGFDWHPDNREMWFTDNGRDELDRDLSSAQRQKIVDDMMLEVPPGGVLNDLIPQDELNHVSRAGNDFGFPHCHGKLIRDPDFGGRADCSSGSVFKLPEVELGGHVAALGMKFTLEPCFRQRLRIQFSSLSTVPGTLPATFLQDITSPWLR
jgi:glucose/arabinose dehydrogenase